MCTNYVLYKQLTSRTEDKQAVCLYNISPWADMTYRAPPHASVNKPF